MRLRLLLLIITVCAAALCVSTQASHQSAPEARPLTAAERRGRMIYLRGETASKKPLMAMVGDLEVPAATMNCAGCHGRRGEGKTEGGVAAGNLTWSNLTKSYGHTHPTGRKHGAFNESSFTTAVVRGVDPAGNE